MTDTAAPERPYALVVDDDGLLRLDISEILESVGFRALEACDGDEAMAILERRHSEVALLFSDVEMPGTRNGIDLARDVAVCWPAISIVVASGRVRPGQGELPEGARFIGKPFSAETVHGHLQEVIPERHKPDGLIERG